MPFAQMLLYPVLDRRMNTESYRKFVDTPLCNSENMKVYWKLYGGDGCSPMEEKCLEGLPPAYVEAAEFDYLHDEAAVYSEHLRAAGVPVEFHEVKGAMHGYDIALDTPLMHSLMEQRIGFLKK